MKRIVLYLLLLFSGAAGAQAIVVPDAAFLAKLMEASAINTIAKDSDGDAMAIDANGNGTITEEEAAEVRELNVSGSNIASLAGIEYFVNLRELDCSGNTINGTVNLSALEDLRGFYCANNYVTAILFAINNDIRWLNCNNNQLSSLPVTGLEQLQSLNCGANQLATLDVTGLNYLSELRCNDNNLTTLDLNSNTALTFLACYGNDLVTLFVKNGQIETFDPLNWAGSPTLEYICADQAQVPLIQANASLPATTQVNSYCSYEPGGLYNRITGTARFDADGNGCSGTDGVIPSLRVKVTGGAYEDTVFTKADGTYVFYIVVTGSYTVTPEFENEYFTAAALEVVNVGTLTGGTSTRNICVTANGVHNDVEVVIAPATSAQPGLDADYKMVYKNKGNQTISTGSVTCFWDNTRLTYQDANPPVSSSGVNTYTWDYYNLKPFESKVIDMKLTINGPTSIPPVNVGDELIFGMSIDPGTDDMPDDNYFEFKQSIVASENENSIVCIEGETVSPDAIGDYLHYIVDFKNTGTEPADFVVIEMDVDPDQFDTASLRLINSSQEATARTTGNKVEFRLDSAPLSVAGHGNILYKIKSRNGIMAGESITTRANIYYQYNFPVATNNAVTTFAVLSTGDFEKDNSIVIYPNPSKGVVMINADTDIKSIQLYDIHGRLLQTGLINATEASFDVSNRAAGIYILKITTDEGVKVEKLIRE